MVFVCLSGVKRVVCQPYIITSIQVMIRTHLLYEKDQKLDLMSGEISVVIMMRLHRRAGIDMNKKILVLAVVAVVLILPGVYFGGLIPLTATTYSFSPVYDDKTLYQISLIVVEGTLVKDSSYVEWHISGNYAVPSISTVWSLQQNESFKGPGLEIVEFIVDGGTYNMVHHAMHSTELNRGDDVIVFLSKDADSIYKDNYYLTGIESGVFKIKDGFAANEYTNSSHDADSFKSSLRSFG